MDLVSEVHMGPQKRLSADSRSRRARAIGDARHTAQGLNVIPSTSAHYVEKLKSETKKWATAAQVAKIQPE